VAVSPVAAGAATTWDAMSFKDGGLCGGDIYARDDGTRCVRAADPLHDCGPERTAGHGQTRPQTQPKHRAGRQPRAGLRAALPPSGEGAARSLSGEATQAGRTHPRAAHTGEAATPAWQAQAPMTQD
jgi:hypothetical protein